MPVEGFISTALNYLKYVNKYVNIFVSTDEDIVPDICSSGVCDVRADIYGQTTTSRHLRADIYAWKCFKYSPG